MPYSDAEKELMGLSKGNKMIDAVSRMVKLDEKNKKLREENKKLLEEIANRAINEMLKDINKMLKQVLESPEKLKILIDDPDRIEKLGELLGKQKNENEIEW